MHGSRKSVIRTLAPNDTNTHTKKNIFNIIIMNITRSNIMYLMHNYNNCYYLLTWSLGCTGSFDPSSPPQISIALLLMTSLTFMFV